MHDDQLKAEIYKEIVDLCTEHRDLDHVISRLLESSPYDQVQIQRLKKRKLWLKDQIKKLKAQLTPDIIA